MTASALDEKRELSRRHTEQSASEGRRSQQITRSQTIHPNIPDGMMVPELEGDNDTKLPRLMESYLTKLSSLSRGSLPVPISRVSLQ